MINESNSTNALEATNTDFALGPARDTLSFKNAQIALLEERLFKQSVELASLQAREDERQGSAKATSDVQADLVDDGAMSSQRNRKSLFGFMPGWGSKARDSVIGSIIKLDRSDKSEDLTVDFPAEGRRSTMMTMDEHPTLSANASAVHFEEGAVRKPKRRSKRKSLSRLRELVSLRKIGSTVFFPSADDDDSLGFE